MLSRVAADDAATAASSTRFLFQGFGTLQSHWSSSESGLPPVTGEHSVSASSDFSLQTILNTSMAIRSVHKMASRAAVLKARTKSCRSRQSPRR